jgi:hypothetical protein
VDVVTPALTKLYEDKAAVAAAEIGKPGLVPLSDIAAREALHKSISGTYRAERVSKTEALRTSNMALKET